MKFKSLQLLAHRSQNQIQASLACVEANYRDNITVACQVGYVGFDMSNKLLGCHPHFAPTCQSDNKFDRSLVRFASSLNACRITLWMIK